MKRKTLFLALALTVLCGCAPAAEGPAPTPAETPSGSAAPAGTPDAAATPVPEVPGDWTLTRCRIVDGADTGRLILAGEGPYEVYTLDVSDMVVTLDGGSSGPTQLRDGMWVDVGHTGLILETYPAQFADPRTVGGNTEGLDDRCGLYLQVMEDLWNTDPGLNGGVKQIGVDLSGLTDLGESEKAAAAYAFGMAHGILPVEGTYDELVEQGYITGYPLEGTDHLAYEWTDGILFTLTTNTGAAWSLPAIGPGEKEPTLTAFDAQKWRSGTGAYFYVDCTAAQAEDGTWTYQVGSEAIS